MPVNVLGHEGEFSADGLIYYATGILPGALTAIDVTYPRAPRAISSSVTGQYSHGLSTNPSGDRLYLVSRRS